MAATLVKRNKLKKTVSKKSHSWWWDSHVSPKNSRWLQENLEEMDQNIKRMLKLIEHDADSFAKKAEMYYQKRPELINLVEEFYRMYRSLAERYDHVTGELRKSIPSDLQSQGSGISDISSEPPSTLPSPDRRPSRRKSGTRAAGFEFFLGAGGNGTDMSNKEGDESSTLDSDSESDDSSVNNYTATHGSDDDQGLRKRIIELEVELRDAKEKFLMLQEEISEGSHRGTKNENSEILLARLAGYEEELRKAREKIRLSEEQINMLKDELQKYKTMEFTNSVHGKDVSVLEDAVVVEDGSKVHKQELTDLHEPNGDSETVHSEDKIHNLKKELKITKEKLLDSEKEVARLSLELQNNGSAIHGLQDQLGSAQKDISTWKTKLEKERREVLKLQDRIVRYKSNVSDRDQEIRRLRETISNANESLSEENSQLRTEITRMVKEKTYLEDNLKEMDLRCQSLEEDVRRIKVGKAEMEAMLGAEIDELRVGILEKSSHVEELNRSLDTFKLNYETLRAEKDALDAKIVMYVAEISSKDIRFDEMNKHLHQLHVQHVELIARADVARKQAEELQLRIKELEREVGRQRELILEGAEEKREAIRQLCFSLEHYRNGYHMLRQAVIGHKRLPVMAS
ncbi:protein NETWORKED 4A isoform X2 [Coffea arabica]|nr:protein NETWORKED 4A-like isoform X2 [Coffea arabica]